MSRPANRGDGGAAGERQWALRYLRPHASAFAVAAGISLLVDLVALDGWWFFWPVLIWGFALLVHYLYVKSISTDDRWVAQRSSDIRYRAYDLSHIEDIRHRHEDSSAPNQSSEKSQD